MPSRDRLAQLAIARISALALVALAATSATVARADEPRPDAPASDAPPRQAIPEPRLPTVRVDGLPRRVSLGSEACVAPCVLRVDPGVYVLDVQGVPSRRVTLGSRDYRLTVDRPVRAFVLGATLVGAALALVPAGFVVQASNNPCASMSATAQTSCTPPSTYVWLLAGGLGLIGVLPLVVGTVDLTSGVRARLSRGDTYLSGSVSLPRVAPWAAPSADLRGASAGVRVSF